MQDLWPAITFEEEFDSPVSILKEQAALLGNKTQNVVTAEVGLLGTSTTEQFVNGFYLVAPALENYRYRLFTISHSVNPYPVIFELDEPLYYEVGDPELVQVKNPRYILKARNEQEFATILQAIFASERTRQIINVLRAQSIAFN
jgi:hypothetical protein